MIPKILTITNWDGKDKGDALAHEYLSIDHLQEWIDLWKTVPPLYITQEIKNELLEELETFIYEKEKTK